MKKWLLLILLFHLYIFKWTRKILIRRLEDKARRKDLRLHVQGIQRSGFAAIRIAVVSYSLPEKTMVMVKDVTLEGQFGNIFRRNKPVIRMQVGECTVTTSGLAALAGSSELNDSKATDRATLYLEKSIRLVCSLLCKVAQWLPDHMQCGNISFTFDSKYRATCTSITMAVRGQRKRRQNRFAIVEVDMSGAMICLPGAQVFDLPEIAFSNVIAYSGSEITFTENSQGRINNIPFRFYGRFSISGERAITVGLGFSDICLQNLLQSMRFLSNEHLKKSGTKGTLTLNTLFSMQLDKPHRHRFKYTFENHMEIPAGQNGAFHYLHHPFVHQVRKEGKVVKEIMIDDPADGFIPLTVISPNFLHALVCTEDPNFFSHKGIDPYGISFAIATNLLERKFVRGASTITMQLARNLFLHHNKTISRKLEEILIAWFIEDISKVSKTRILELYLNIIEWGPGIYGIGNACSYYFDKQPGALSLTESLVLTYIIPRPIHFASALGAKTAQLQRNLAKHVRQFARVMLKKEYISQEEFDGIESSIVFTNRYGCIELADQGSYWED